MTYKQWTFIVTLVFLCYLVTHVLLYLGYVVSQLAETLCYKPYGHGFDSRWVIDFFLSGRIMVLVLIQSLTEMSTKNTSWWGEGRGVCGAVK